ncbi:MAG TPA: aminotransferase class IV [Chitinophagales bacterium]|nr:aminotransferase class IV [Chitinophagales bacterium]HMX03310.1 aminotransferase class IV [Chitinophagales bacterium]HNE44781.1 aminotransferase class IV [Chitinophagales bacterium]HNF68165.1 aminotransferase class IV [Chitinophagales bacterium]HNI54897.1 aminotransferase class IV [Chitinophagales bacterium]
MVFYNHNYIQDDALHLLPSNRAFKYGDGIFESCLLNEGALPLMAYHTTRLMQGMQCLHMDALPHLSEKWLGDVIKELALQHGYQSARAKISVWRGGEGLYLPKSDSPELLIEVFPLHSTPFSEAPQQYVIDIYDGLQKAIHPVSACKTMNALPYILAAKFAASHKWNDVLILNTQNEIADAISSNVWLIKDHMLITTPALNGGVEGTMQAWLLDHVEELGFSASRKSLTISDVESADAVFLTNAIKGIIPVTRFREKAFTNNLPLALLRDVKTLLFA